jgi:D-mannonate dehydratase
MTLNRISQEMHEEVKALPKELHDSRITNQAIDRSPELEALHANYLEYDRKIEILRWELTFIEWKIKSSIYNYEKVVDLATWKRTLSPSSSELDVEAVKKHHPALYDAYMETKPGKWSVHINPFRPYPINAFSLNEFYSECIETV